MSTSRNLGKAKTSILKSMIDVSSGPRNASDPRGLRGTQQMMASRLAGKGLKYDEQGKLAVDPQTVELLDLATNNIPESLVQGIEALAFKGYLGRLIAWDLVTAATNTSTTEFTLASLEIPRNYLIGTHAVRMVSWGDVLNNTGGGVGFDFAVDLNANRIFADVSSATALATGANRRLYLIDVTLNALNNATGVHMYGNITVTSNNGASVGRGNLTANDTIDVSIFQLNSVTVDGTVPQDLAFKVAMSTSSANYEWRHYGSHLFAY